ncbi:MAG: hypothetical protein H6831_10770 [Planctomycetes bacterium]|nr:hypothetical protein [Planctomycetota bacterium]MCB9904879.1 hypothetical protein [Planctomycetota bacterium]
MDPRVRSFVWAGMALLAAVSLRPAGEVLAADLRGTSVENAEPNAEVVTVEQTAATREDSIETASERRS